MYLFLTEIFQNFYSRGFCCNNNLLLNEEKIYNLEFQNVKVSQIIRFVIFRLLLGSSKSRRPIGFFRTRWAVKPRRVRNMQTVFIVIGPGGHMKIKHLYKKDIIMSHSNRTKKPNNLTV